MKTFKEFLLEVETLQPINPVNIRQSIPLYGKDSTLPPGLKLEPINPTNSSVTKFPSSTSKTKKLNPNWLSRILNLTSGLNVSPIPLGY